MSESSSRPEPPKRFDFETERKKLEAAAEETREHPEGVHWDKPSPTDSPAHGPREIPRHLVKIVQFFQNIVLDESLVLDLCLERCMEMVKQNVEKKMVGIDNFQDGTAFTPGHYASIAGPMTCELYKQVLTSIKEREEEYKELLADATREREKSSPGGPRIVIPT